MKQVERNWSCGGERVSARGERNDCKVEHFVDQKLKYWDIDYVAAAVVTVAKVFVLLGSQKLVLSFVERQRGCGGGRRWGGRSLFVKSIYCGVCLLDFFTSILIKIFVKNINNNKKKDKKLIDWLIIFKKIF